MNPSDSNRKPSGEETVKPVTTADSAKKAISQEEIDQYMRMVGRLLYDIILDWVKKQQGQPQGATNPPLNELLSPEGREL